MARFLFLIPFILSRFCRAQINDGDQIVLACLKQNRAKLSKACAKVLTDHGQ